MRVPLDTQRSFYLTLISMIQSLAFGYLLTTLSLRDPLTFAYCLQVFGTFIVILLIWHEYAIGTMLYVWMIDFWDSLIPFLFGISQFFLISALNPQHPFPSLWFFCLAAFAALTFCAFWNQFAKAAAYAENQTVLLLLSHSKRRTMLYVGFSCGLFLVEGMLARFSPRRGWLLSTLATVSIMVLVPFALRGIFLYPKIMRTINAVQKTDSISEDPQEHAPRV